MMLIQPMKRYTVRRNCTVTDTVDERSGASEHEHIERALAAGGENGPGRTLALPTRRGEQELRLGLLVTGDDVRSTGGWNG